MRLRCDQDACLRRSLQGLYHHFRDEPCLARAGRSFDHQEGVRAKRLDDCLPFAFIKAVSVDLYFSRAGGFRRVLWIDKKIAKVGPSRSPKTNRIQCLSLTMDSPPARPRVELKPAALGNLVGYLVFNPEYDETITRGVNLACNDPVSMLRNFDESWLPNDVPFDGVAGEELEAISLPLETVVRDRRFALLLHVALGVKNGRPLTE